MLTPRLQRGRIGARRFGRSLRSVAAIITTALVAPAAIASVAVTAATVGATLSAAPASAQAVRTFVVSGDDPTRTGAGSGAWGFYGHDYSQLRAMITDAANFGPTGVVKTASFQIGPQITSPSDASLAGVDVFFSGAIQSGYTAPEEAALQRFVARGGMLIVNTNSFEWDTTHEFGFVTKFPQAVFEPSDAANAHPGIQLTGPTGIPSGRYAAPVPSLPVGSHPILQGPFGTVASFQNWHTVTAFTSVPGNAQTLATITTTCSPNTNGRCSGPPAPPTTTTSAGTTTTVAGPTTTTTPPVTEHLYDQSLTGVTLAVIPPTITAGVRSGAIIASSDVDTYSNHAIQNTLTLPADNSEIYADPMLPGNAMLSKNVFAYIANQLTDGYTPLSAPTRIMSTRDGIGVVQAKVGEGGTKTLQVTGANAIPANATAVALNVTVTNATAASFVSVYPTGSVAGGVTPSTSNLNFSAGQTIPNMVMVQLPATGQLTFFNEKGSVDILVDAIGYFSQGTGDRYNSLATPERALDTRGGNALGAKTPRSLLLAGAGTVPVNATSVVLNVTSANNTAGGFISVYPGDVTTPPNASNLNFVPGLTIPNLVIAKLSPSGTINIYNDAGTSDVLVDVLGYFLGGSGGGSFGALTPARVLDTRTGTGAAKAQVGPGGTVTLTVLGVGGVPATGVRTVLLNVTAAGPTADSFITVWPENTRPNSSNLNTTAGHNVPNLVLAGVGSDGKVRLYNQNGSVDLLADVMGYFS